ncbi:MAG: sugar ABC transporter ATP-binding protein [Anaerolineae bacterium]|nr:sugar ABC transporter ATP-binding protein [Anaerolineae bacterium]
MTALLTIVHASKSYNHIPALIDASLELYGGEVHALMGENGAGKSTLIKLLAGVVSPDSIQLRLNDAPITITHPSDAFRAGLRFIHQELNVVPQLSVAENIFLSQRYPRRAGLFVDWGKLHQAAHAVLMHLGVTHIQPTTIMARLSAGDQMLVKIAAAFAGDNASIYVMDEPTAALTNEEAERLFAVIMQLKARGCAVLYVSHRMDEVFRIADRITIMRDGRVVTTTATADTSPPALIHLMTGRDLQHVYPPRTQPISDSPLLEVNSLHTASLQDVSFSLNAGEIIGLAGLTGSGRSELVQALIGADRVHSGELRLAGQPLTHRDPAGGWSSGLAYVPEERRSQGLILTRSVGNNVTLPHLHYFSHFSLFLNNGHENSLTAMLGDSVRLKSQGSRQVVRELSGGNQQKVVFARAMARSPRVLLLDEPTRGVDVGAKFDIYTLIREASAQGIGILLISSELPELLGLCDRLLIMRRGTLAAMVPAQGLTEAGLLSLCYGELNERG